MCRVILQLVKYFRVFLGGNLVTWRNKKKNVVSHFSAKSGYRAMTQAACEILWVEFLLKDLGVQVKRLIPMYCDNKAATFHGNNPAFHELTKPVKVDCHFIKDVYLHGQISTSHLDTENQLADIFIRALQCSCLVLLFPSWA